MAKRDARQIIVAAICAWCVLHGSAKAENSQQQKWEPSAPQTRWQGVYSGLTLGAARGVLDFSAQTDLQAWGGQGLSVAIENTFTVGRTHVAAAAGAVVGFNHQIGNYVVGAEADLNYADLRFWAGNPGLGTVLHNFGGVGGMGARTDQRFASDWLGTLRFRHGLVIGPALVYGTYGVAAAHVSAVDTLESGGPLGNGINTQSGSQAKIGWVLGGGMEWPLAPNWSLRAESLYVDLGTYRFVAPRLAMPNPNPPPADIVFNHQLTEAIARIGLIFHY